MCQSFAPFFPGRPTLLSVHFSFLATFLAEFTVRTTKPIAIDSSTEKSVAELLFSRFHESDSTTFPLLLSYRRCRRRRL